jgi:hypothetical protein
MRIFLQQLLLACSLILSFPAHAQVTDAEQWHGELATPAGTLSLLVRLQREASGAVTGDLESVSQAPGQKIPLGAVKANFAKG